MRRRKLTARELEQTPRATKAASSRAPKCGNLRELVTFTGCACRVAAFACLQGDSETISSDNEVEETSLLFRCEVKQCKSTARLRVLSKTGAVARTS